jgi:hypothetical protein
LTRTLPNGTESTITYLQTVIVCAHQCEPRRTNPQWAIAIDEVQFDASTETVDMTLRNVGALSVTLDKAIIWGNQNNTGFQGEITVDLAILLEKNQITNIKSPNLPNLAEGDTITIKVSTIEGSFATFTSMSDSGLISGSS